MKYNLSIAKDAKLFRELEKMRGREKRSTFIEHPLILSLETYKKRGVKVKPRKAPVKVLSPTHLIETKQ